MKKIILAVCLGVFPVITAAQKPPAPMRRLPSLLERAAGATELPLPPWGPYSRAHSGPCFLADRNNGTLFAFPIVIGQRRIETLMRPVTLPNGKTQFRAERVMLNRRLTGFAPLTAQDDDRQISGNAMPMNREMRLLEADGSGTYWNAGAVFAPAAVSENALNAPDTDGKITPSAEWGAGEAAAAYFPANVSPGGDGLLIRITLRNRSRAMQTYFTDLLGGMDAETPNYSPADVTIERDAAATDDMMIKQKQTPLVFALASNVTQFPQRSYRVSDRYFSPEGAVSERNATGTALPAGLLQEPDSVPANAKTAAKTGAEWGLLRIDDIVIAPGETVTISLCVGIGKSNEDAAAAAQSLLAQCEDTLPDGSARNGGGLAAKALNAHRAARFHSGSEAVDLLLAQSLINTPETGLRRVGVPSRRTAQNLPGGTYQPENGGWMALGWNCYRQDWSAAQLNAYFLTEADLAPAANPQAAPPVNLLALWELYQKSQDKAMLARFYPYAKRRYQEFITAGQAGANHALFAWPASPARSNLALTAAGQNDSASRVYAPDYCAYVIRAAKILRLMAEEIRQSPAEIIQYGRDISAVTTALNESLWDEKRGCYAAKPAAGGAFIESGSAESQLLPLIAGEAVPPVRRAALLKNLADAAAFWSDSGVRSRSKADTNYQAGTVSQGAVGFGANWLLWKSLLDAGMAEQAAKLADNLLRAYAAQSAVWHCPQALDGDTGAALGVMDFTGDSCALMALHAAYHTPGTVSAGWDCPVRGAHYDRENDTLRFSWRMPDAENAAKLLCVMGRPNGKYQISGFLSAVVTADANGLLTLTAPRDTGTQSLEIMPVSK